MATPKAYIRKGTKAAHPVVCLGDSLTQAVLSADYLGYLTEEFGPQGYEFINAGYSGDTAYDVLQRVDETVACHPEIVIVACGANDAAAHISPPWMIWYLKDRKSPLIPTIEWFAENMTKIFARLQKETTAKLAALELPLFTEELNGEVNARVQRYNGVLHQVADEAGVPVIPLYEPMAALIPADFTPPAWDLGRDLMGKALTQHYLMRRSWDEISKRNGFLIHTDQAHMNSTGARLIANQIAEWIRTV
ncbi:MAG: GDSL-type esterase/lipase family protein [Propionibacteriaceae bacterium]|jgi:lysophospholipase L1-like esterase|nr:GDSL-type esterase/lipase family protein [Propionibacteriaceae bacterium]